MSTEAKNSETLVNLTIDQRQVSVPKGTNLIEAAKLAGVEIPYYCYHPHLSVAGNCRMCQCKVGGKIGDGGKLSIACNTQVQEGMVVYTQQSAPEVAEAQRATLEFILINHPLDCTVCDQAGHCKLQDYYYDYNAEPSRFTEEKVHKVKAEPLGPEVMLDGERCILCSRCVRFCDEITETSELGMFNRGDHTVIGVVPGKELTNPLAGSVVDLCPVGALTHRRWRFNTRIWYTDQVDTICVGCSTGCNVKVATRDGEFVLIKSRLNSAVNQEWLCDEGRYGFDRFQPKTRSLTPTAAGQSINLEQALKLAQQALSGQGALAVFLSPLLTVEDIFAISQLVTKSLGGNLADVAVQIRERSLTAVEAKLVSPDYAPNAYGAQLILNPAASAKYVENFRAELEKRYLELLERVRSGGISRILLVGHEAIRDVDIDAKLREVLRASSTVVLSAKAPVGENFEALAKVVFPTRSVYEKDGTMINSSGRIQRLKTVLKASQNLLPIWEIVKKLSAEIGAPAISNNVTDDRSFFRSMVEQLSLLEGLTLAEIGDQGVSIYDRSVKASDRRDATAKNFASSAVI